MSEDEIELLGMLAGTLTTASFIPQVAKVLRDKTTAGISLGMYAAFTSGVALWILYGLLLDRPAIVAANLVTLLLAGVVLILKLRHG